MTLAYLDEEEIEARSQARRVAHCFQSAASVELDCAGSCDIGKSFADEMFRVFPQAHPQICFTPLYTAPTVAQMVERAVAARVGRAPQGGGAMVG